MRILKTVYALSNKMQVREKETWGEVFEKSRVNNN
jgi:hypothetical protein